MTPAERDIASLSRSAGGLALAAGVIVVLLRKADSWTDFKQFIVAAVPAALLFLLAAGERTPQQQAPAPWRSVLLVVSILLSVLALFQFLDWVGASTKHLLYDAAVLVVTAGIALAGARRANSHYAVLLAALALLVAWLLVWLKILDHPGADAVRWVILGGGAVLLAAAFMLARNDPSWAREVAIIGGLGLVVAGILGVFVGAIELFLHSLGDTGIGPGGLFRGGVHLSGAQTSGWDVYLVVVALALIALGAHVHTRGLGYVGATGLLLFALSTGAQLTDVESGHRASHAVAGWPLILVIGGLAGLVLPMLAARRAN